MTDGISRFVYVTYIRTTPEQLWKALTAPEFTTKYWFGVTLDTDWRVGSPWRMVFEDGSVTDEGEVAECDPPRRLALRWRHKWRPEMAEEGEAFCVIELEPQAGGAVKLVINHTLPRPGSKLIEAVSGGWPSILSNLKSLLETGEVLMTRPGGAPKR